MEISISRDGLSRKQLLYLNSNEDRVLFGGARGGGKSHVNRIGCVEDAVKLPGRKILFIRPTIKSAREQFPTSEMSRIIAREIIDPETGNRYEVWRFNAADSVYTFANGPDSNFPFDGGSRLVLGGVETIQDAYAYQGLEYYSIWVDELTKSDWAAIEYVIGSLRDKEYVPRFRASSNPGERGHRDVKAVFVTPWVKLKAKHPERYPSDYHSKISWKKILRDKQTGEEIPVTFAYIPATLDDNPVEAVRRNYLKILLSLPEHLQKMYREGSWDTYEGKYWDDVDTSKNYLKLQDVYELGIDFEWEKQNMKTFLSMDWGYSDYTAIYWHLETSKGNIITYKEYYFNKKLMEEIAGEVQGINESIGVKPTTIYMPWDIYVKKGGEFKTIGGEVIGEELIDVWRFYNSTMDTKASSDRKTGWANMTSALKGSVSWKSKDDNEQKSAAKWIILKNNCPHLCDQIDSTQIDPRNTEDIKKGGVDHGVDSARMFWVAHIINPTIIEERDAPKEGTGAYMRWQLQKKQKAKVKKQQRYISI